jgi:hypothetical protein
MKNILFKTYNDNRGNEYSYAYICLGVPKMRGPHLAEDDRLHLLENEGTLGVSICNRCLNIRRLKKYPK